MPVFLLVVFAALVLAGAGSPKPAEAATCTPAGACDGWGSNVTVGTNSCNGVDACDNLGANVVVGANSCNADRACVSAGSDGGTAAIGDNSCNFQEACQQAGDGGFAQIGDGSCNGGQWACLWAGENEGSFTGGQATIGDDSCVGFSACDSAGRNGGDSTIGNGACHGEEACAGSGYKGGPATVGDGSCNGAFVCQTNYDGVVSSVGQYSCNNDDEAAPCRHNADDIGDCVFNDEQPLECSTSLEVLHLQSLRDSGRFDLLIDDEVQASGVGIGATSKLGVAPGEHSVSQEAVLPASLSQYTTFITCRDDGGFGGIVAAGIGNSLTLDVEGGDDIVCTMYSTASRGARRWSTPVR